ncbi:MAG: hypothetical protein F6J87_24360 [Spirulina sp. SIO3F2]|nr:hypothetical protein [Spirulina sp. SIO3F2]
MRFRNRQQVTKMPTIDLTPMLTVMMGVLGFFVVISTITSAPLDRVEVRPPSGDDNAQGEASSPKSLKPLIVCLQNADQAKVEGKTLTQEEVLGRVGEFVSTNQQARVAMVSEPTVPYQQMLTWLATLRTTGGDRVDLAYDPGESSASKFCD